MIIQHIHISMRDMIGTKTFIARGVNMAFQKGIVVICKCRKFRCNCRASYWPPADAVGALTIGAVKSDETYASL